MTEQFDDFSQPITEYTDVQLSFQKKCDAAMSKIGNVKDFRASDAMVDFVFNVGRQLFDVPLDKQDNDWLLRHGGKLTGAYVYLGQKSAYARARRDVYAQQLSETEKKKLLGLLHAGIKVTEARAAVAGEISELNTFVVQADIEKNQWENITEAVERMTSFIQSAIRLKDGERFHSANLRDNG